MKEQYVMDITDYEELEEVMIYDFYPDTKELGNLVEALDKKTALAKYNIVGDVINNEINIYGDEEDLFYDDFSSENDDD